MAFLQICFHIYRALIDWKENLYLDMLRVVLNSNTLDKDTQLLIIIIYFP